FSLKLVADFSGTDQDAVGFFDFGIRNDVQEILEDDVFNWRARVSVAQHALRSEYDERLAPMTQGLAAKQMEILRGVARLRDLDVVFGGQLDEALNASAGMFRALTFVAVGQEHHDAGEQVPLGFTGADELVDDGL